MSQLMLAIFSGLFLLFRRPYYMRALLAYWKVAGVTGAPRSSRRYSSRATLACMLLVISLAGFCMKMVMTADPMDAGG